MSGNPHKTLDLSLQLSFYPSHNMRPQRGRDEKNKVVVEPHKRHQGVFIAKGKIDKLCTKNMTPGKILYPGDKIVSFRNEDEIQVEYRIRNPSKSDLAALILRGVNDIGIKPGSKVLYLGAACARTVSHVSDIVGPNGLVYAAESSNYANLVSVAVNRSNVVPIIEDPSDPDKYLRVVVTVDVILSDLLHRDRVEILISNASHFLKDEGRFVLSLKGDARNPSYFRLFGYRNSLDRHELKVLEELTVERDHQYFIGAYRAPMEEDYDTALEE